MYQAAGVRVANVNLNLNQKDWSRDVSGRLGVTSQIEEIEDIGVFENERVVRGEDGFAADAWLRIGMLSATVDRNS